MMEHQRKVSRRPVLVSRKHCELRIGSFVLPGLLLNESDSGASVLVAGLPSTKRALLHNHSGWFDCRVVYCMEVEPTKVTPCVKDASILAAHKMKTIENKFDEHGVSHTSMELFDCDDPMVQHPLSDRNIAGLEPYRGDPWRDNHRGAAKREKNAAKYVAGDDIKKFVADKDGPWYRLGIHYRRKIAQASDPVTSLPIASGGANPMQWIKNMLSTALGN